MLGDFIKKKKAKEEEQIRKNSNKPTGGIPFFISLISVLILGILNLISLPSLQNEQSPRNWELFGVGVLVGLLVAKSFFVNHLSVACHELKHYLLARLAGNKFKNMNVKQRSGHMTYSYTKSSKKFNALIALAPYWFPLMTIFAIFLSIPAYFSFPDAVFAIVGIGVGADFLMNMRDISPIQTDLTKIRGGMKVALAFIVGMNLSLLTIIAAWVSQGFVGIKLLGIKLFDIIVSIYQYYTNLSA